MADIKLNLEGCRAFDYSPDAGEPDCLCSKCGSLIGENECPIRLFIDVGRKGEYRFHAKCFEEIGSYVE